MVRKALGKGIEALIPAADKKGKEDTLRIPVKLIADNPYQPRKVSGREVRELAASIKEHGLLQPVVVRRKGTSFQLVAGSRRLKAAREAGLKEVPALIRDADDRHMLALALVENLQREDLNPIERALAYRQLSRDFSMTQDEIARLVGRDRSTVANTLRLLGLPRKARLLLEEGKITEGHARALLQASSVSLAEKLCEKIVKQGLSVRETEKLVRTAAKVSVTRVPKRKNGILVDAEELISEKLGVKTSVTPGRKGGRIVIRYADQRELTRLLEWFKNR